MVEYSLSPFQLGLVFLAFNLPYAILQIPFGMLSRRLGRKRLMVTGFLVNAAALTALGITNGIVPLVATLLIAGVGGSTYHSLGIPLISDMFPSKRGEALGYHQTGGSIGSFIAPLIIGALIETSNWHSAILVLSALGFVLSPVLWYCLYDSPIKIIEDHEPTLRGLGEPLILVLAAAIYIVPFRGVQSFGPVYFDDEPKGKGLGPQAYVLYSLSQIAGIFSGPICGRLSDALDRKRIVISLVVVLGISSFGIVYLSGALLYLTLIIFGFAAFGLLATMDALIADVIDPRLFPTAVGINLAASFAVTSILSPVLGASIGVYGYDFSFALLAIFPFLSIPLILYMKPHKQRK
jgi:MFS family permease